MVPPIDRTGLFVSTNAEAPVSRFRIEHAVIHRLSEPAIGGLLLEARLIGSDGGDRHGEDHQHGDAAVSRARAAARPAPARLRRG